MKLNKDEPHEIIFGAGGIKLYKQGGREFAANGREIIAGKESPVDTGKAALSAEELQRMHWKELKILVEQSGGEWLDKAAAVEFLTGK